MASVVAVCAVHTLREDAGTVGITAIDKRPVAGAVRVGPYGVRADVQADRKHHGGLDQAVYVYSDEDAAYWEGELGRTLAPGFFGENLRTEGIDVNDARIGERWRIGERLIVEVTSPRKPCQTFARWVGGVDERGWVKRFTAAGRPGPYLRVVQVGDVRAGDEITVIEKPADAPSIRDALGAPTGR